MNRLLPTLIVAALAPLSCPLGAQSFSQGDVYLATIAATGLSTGNGGIIRIDPVSGATSLVAGPFGFQSYHDMVAYDPYRDRLVFPAAAPDPTTDPVQLWEMDAAGTMQPLGVVGQWLAALAPTGDGRIYHRQVGVPAGRVRYLDAANQLHDLMDATGTQPFTFVPGFFLQYQHLLYHEPTNSLLAAARHANPTCGTGALSQAVAVFRAPLSVDGTRVVGPVTCNHFEVSSSGEVPVGFSRMSDGDLLMVCDTNSGLSEPRLLRVDPFTLAISTFASNGHVGAAATNAGCFSSTIGRAVILDTGNDVLRTFGQGESGDGIILPAGAQPVSPGGSSGEVATMIEINRAPCTGSYSLYGTGLAGSGGFVPAMSATGCPEAGGNIALHVTSGFGGANGALLVGFSQLSLPVLGGTLLVNPAFTAPIALSGTPGTAGDGNLSIPLAVGSPSILQWYFQAILLDPGAVQSLSMSNGLGMSL